MMAPATKSCFHSNFCLIQIKVDIQRSKLGFLQLKRKILALKVMFPKLFFSNYRVFQRLNFPLRINHQLTDDPVIKSLFI